MVKKPFYGGVSTPWGISQGNTARIAVGLCGYSTAGHGGLAVSFSLATRMSPWARQQGVRHGGRWWYEEDAAWAIPIFELYDREPAIGRHYRDRGIDDIKQQAEQVMRRWYPGRPTLEENQCATK